MHVTRIRCSNFCCHESLDIELGPGLCGIIGSNGSGKSTILDMIRFAFTGESASDGAKADNVAWGKETASVTVCFTHGDGDYSITRTCGKRNGQRLTTPDGDFTKKVEIDSFVERLCDTPISALLSYVFVPQGKIDAILLSTPTQRLKDMQQTMGLQQAEASAKLLATEIGRYNVTPGIDRQTELAGQALAAAKDTYTQHVQTMEAIESEIRQLQPKVQELERVERIISTNQAIVAVDRRIASHTERLEEAQKVLDERTEELERIHAMVEQTQRDATDARAVLAEHEAQVRLQQSLDATRTQLAETQEALDALPEPVDAERISALKEKLESLNEKIQLRVMQLDGRAELPMTEELDEAQKTLVQLREQYATVEREWVYEEKRHLAEVGRLQTHLKTFYDGVCPTCHRPVEDCDTEDMQRELGDAQKAMGNARDAYERTVADLKARIEPLEHTVTTHATAARTAVQESHDKLVTRRAAVIDAIQSAEADIAKRAKLESTRTHLETHLQEHAANALDADTLQQVHATVEAFDRLQLTLRDAQAKMSISAAAVDTAVVNLEEAQEERTELGELADIPPEADLAEAREAAEIVFARTQSRDKVRQEIIASEVRVEQCANALAALEEQRRVEARDAAWVAICRMARDALHVSGLPQLLMREYALTLNKRMKHYLSVRWEAPFTLELDEDLAFVARFDDGRVLSGARLSGGQKVVAATSFRLAMADTFARQVGLLVLDEPSNHLDEDNIMHLRQLLTQLRDLASTSGRQIIIVDHEESLVGFFDHVITLNSERVPL